MPTKKQGSTYRLTDHAKGELHALADLWGLSAAAVLDVAVRQLALWVRSSPPPPGLEETLKKVVEDQAAGLPSGKTRQGRPRKQNRPAG